MLLPCQSSSSAKSWMVLPYFVVFEVLMRFVLPGTWVKSCTQASSSFSTLSRQFGFPFLPSIFFVERNLVKTS